MINLLITGASGQLGTEIQMLASLYPHYTFFFTHQNELDISNNIQLNQFLTQNKIHVIINCAAYTAVDKAETESILSNEINHLAVKNLAMQAKEKNIQLIHISTDYVFNGENFKPYLEDDIPNPQNYYGKVKLAGEETMKEINPQNSIIVRTSWLYSSHGNNFVKTMLRLGAEKDSLSVVFDQIGTPTYAGDLAKALLDILPYIKNDHVEIYHYSNEGVLSWYDFAKEIMKMAKLTCKVLPIETKDYPTPAKRPYYSVLNKRKIKDDFGLHIPYWKDSLSICLKQMGAKR